MGRPKHATVTGNGEWLWTKVEQVRAHVGLTTDAMASIMGMTGGQYRGWKSKGEMPADAWIRFERYRATVTENTIGKAETHCLIWDAQLGDWVPMVLPHPIIECKNRHSGCKSHRETFIPSRENQAFCCMECKRDYEKEQKRVARSLSKEAKRAKDEQRKREQEEKKQAIRERTEKRNQTGRA